MSSQVVDVLTHLATQTKRGRLKWRRTDVPGTFLLSRPEGTVVVGKAEEAEVPPDFTPLFVRFLSGGDGSIEYEFVETSETTLIHRPLHDLWDLVADKTSDVSQTMTRWLDALTDMEDPF